MIAATPIHASAAATDHACHHPVAELLCRYSAIFKAAWAMRVELAGPGRLADERAFLPAVLALQESPVHPAPRRAALAICALFLIALMWAIFGRLDIVAVAQGRIVVNQRTKTIQPLERSVVKAIHVIDGDWVEAGQILIELDATATQADHSRVMQERSAALADAWRASSLMRALQSGTLTAKIPQEPGLVVGDAEPARTQLLSDWADIRAKLARHQAEIDRRRAEIATAEQLLAKLQATVPLAEARARDYQSLAAQGFISHHANQDRMRERIEIERDLATATARLFETRAALRESEQSLSAFKAEMKRTCNDRQAQAELKVKQMTHEYTKAELRNALTRLTAPVAGRVQQLAIHTAGGVVTEAQVLMVLVPDDADVTAEVTLENKDVGFVSVGQTAEIKLETFPFTRYGTVPAQVRSISADAVNDEKRGAVFPTTLVLLRNQTEVDGKAMKLTPGMNLTAEIKTGKRRVIEYLLNPVQQHVHESLKER